MLRQLTDHNSDIKRLQDEGYEIEFKGGYLITHHIPYVNKDKCVLFGKLIVQLTLNGYIASYPKLTGKHVIHFMGEQPCQKDGTPITSIIHANPNQRLTDDLVINHSFSNKPPNDYNNYYEQVTRYIEIISSPAISLDSSIRVQTHKVIESTEDDVFQYEDTCSSRANTYYLNNKFRGQKIAIIGLGGTGSYILDLIAKTPVAEIHLYDGDIFSQHNAFRAPGAPSKEALNAQMYKSDYFASIYKNMHKTVISHSVYLTESNIHELSRMSHIFICIDKDSARNTIVKYLIEKQISFIDVGMGVNIVGDHLIGTVRTTSANATKNDHITRRLPLAELDDNENEYSTNIQIADLNALNAVFAVIKWKKLSSFYQDYEQEFHSTYSINDSNLLNEETIHS